MRGRPWVFRCTGCRRRGNRRLAIGPFLEGTKLRVELLDKERHQPTARNPDDIALKYRCSDCGHVGWSTHPTLKPTTYYPTSVADALE